MLYLVLGLVLAAFGLLIAALTTANTLFAWVSVVVSVLAAGLLVTDWLNGRRRARDAADEAEPDPVLLRPEQPLGDQAPPLTERRRGGSSRAGRRGETGPPDSPRADPAEAGAGSSRADVLEQEAGAEPGGDSPPDGPAQGGNEPDVAGPQQTGPARAEPVRAEAARGEPARSEPARGEAPRAEAARGEPAEEDLAKDEPAEERRAADERADDEPVEERAGERAGEEPGEEQGRERSAVLSGRRAEEARRTIVDEHGEPGEEPTDAADLLIVTDLRAEVRVVDEHPRYHLATCGYLLDRPTLPLPVAEARQLGFTPCVRCGPDATLVARHRATR
ncbi:MAG TPA: hypothetical protein VGP26_08385 [Actinophytocola sp.]|nr:hypothetical protein [Actinophytocola sp.]